MAHEALCGSHSHIKDSILLILLSLFSSTSRHNRKLLFGEFSSECVHRTYLYGCNKIVYFSLNFFLTTGKIEKTITIFHFHKIYLSL